MSGNNEEQDLRKLEELLQTRKIFYMDRKILLDIRQQTKKDIQVLRQFVSAKVFTEGIFKFMSYIMERSYLIHVLNTFTELKIADLRQSGLEWIYFLNLYDGEIIIMIFCEPADPIVKQLNSDDIFKAVNNMSIVSSFLILLAKNDKTEALSYLLKEKDKDETKKKEFQSRDPKAEFIKRLKNAINELQHSGRGKVDKSKVARLLDYNVNTFSDELTKYKIKYEHVNKVFKNIETGEIY